MNRLTENTVFSGLVTAWRLATWPTSRSPSLPKPTTDGVVRAPSWLTMTTGWPFSMTETTEFVVPRSIPMTLPLAHLSVVLLRTAIRCCQTTIECMSSIYLSYLHSYDA